MPGPIATAFVEVREDMAGFEQGVTGKLGGIAKKAAGIFAAGFAAQKGFDFLKGSVAEAEEARKVTAQTEAVIKSTGGAARVSAKDVDALANSISRKTGIDDEAIAKASNLLLTFTGVRNEVGKGNDIFNQATKIAADMGAALGTDAAGSAIQLGKALNDPIKGITALTRVGVTFSDEQKKQIKTLQEAGKTAEAQKIILAELAKEFGGSAEAQATAGAKLKVTFDNIKEDLGKKLLPIIDKVATFLADKLPGAMAAAGRAFSTLSNAAKPVIDAIKNVFDVLRGTDPGDIVGPGSGLRQFLLLLFDIREKALPAIKKVSDFIEANLKPILIGLGAAALVVAGPIVALGAAFVLAYTKSEAFRNIIGKVVENVSGFITGMVAFVQENLPKFQEAFDRVANAVVAIFNQFKGTVLPVIEAVISTATAIIGRLVDTVKQVVLFVTNIINGDFAAAFGNLKNIVGNIIGAVVDIIKGLVPSVAGLVVGVVSAMTSLVKGIKDKAGDVISTIKKFVLDKVPGFVKKFFGISSPSTMFAGFGEQLMAGLAQGIARNGNVPQSALDGLGLGVGALGNPALSGGGGSLFGPGAINVTFAGAMPTAEQAYLVGQQVGVGAADAIARQNARRARRAA